MARIRTIKPEFFTSEDIVSITPLARLFYIGLWCEADREGRLAWRPKTLKLRYLPADDCNIDALADELKKNGMLVMYSQAGKDYCEIPSFAAHQVINNRERDSQIPAKGREGKEGKGREGRKDRESLVDTALSRVDGFSDWFEKYKQMRKTIKKPMTENAEQLALEKLEKFDDPVAVLKQSVFNSWQGLFPLKEDSNDGTRLESDIEKRNTEYLAQRKAEAEAPEGGN